MNKQEADNIILACKKYKIQSAIQKSMDEHLILLEGIERPVVDYQAAKFFVNGLVIEKKHPVTAIKYMKPQPGKKKDPYPPDTYEDSRNSKIRRWKDEETNWSEVRKESRYKE